MEKGIREIIIYYELNERKNLSTRCFCYGSVTAEKARDALHFWNPRANYEKHVLIDCN
ncbi:MAG: hypothetical protein VYD54_04430 [Bdellovibrionota bacterium]|nr:hypothetical protein [Bdellovibrionota bacterium]